MHVIDQSFDDIIKGLSALEVSWMDDTAEAIMDKIYSIPEKGAYSRADIIALLDTNDATEFTNACFCVGLFLGYSKDRLTQELKQRLGPGGIGLKRFRKDKEEYAEVLEELGLLDTMTAIVNTKPKWSDIIKERLRFGRGSAVQGQKRGRELENWTEEVIKSVFGTNYEARCLFKGPRLTAKCDFAIPNKAQPSILVECKGYGATGSKMSDVIGDLDAIIEAKRPDTWLFLITDGLTWNERENDLKKIIERQNEGKIARIYTKKMRSQFEEALEILKAEHRL